MFHLYRLSRSEILILFFFLIFSLFACSAQTLVQPASVIKIAPTPDIIKEYKSVVVWAKKPGMIDTGVAVKGGDSFTILAEGEINVIPSKEGFIKKPEGGSLLYRVGKDNYFVRYFGQELTTVAANEGYLYLGYQGCPTLDNYGEPKNPDFYRDDTGYFAVDIIVWKTNDPVLMAKFFAEASQRDPQKTSLKQISTKFEKRKELFVAEQKAKSELAEAEKAVTAPQEKEILGAKDKENEKKIVELNEKLQKATQALHDLEEIKKRMAAQLAEQQKEAEVAAREMERTKQQPKDILTTTGTRWAAIIGVSQYKDTRIPPLRYAAADAKSFYDWAISPNGGKYAPAMVKLLVDADATGENIKKILFDWLAQAIQEDTVTIFFAGHGSPQSPDHPENLFLLPYDVQYDNISTTGFPMWDIETALKRFIKAKKVIVITDACHAGGVGHAFDVARRNARGLKVVPISSSLQTLSTISDGVCIISASDDNQLSQEGLQWGQGHGVFTYFLLEGLKGKADYNKDGLVTLGELIPFLSEQVRRETRNAQTPTVAGRFDPALSIGK